MSPADRGDAGPQMNDDVLALLVVAVVLGGPVVAMLAGAGDGIATWLVERGVLSRDDLLVAFAAGAGLDLGRVVIVVGVLLALLAWAVHVVQRRRPDGQGPG